MLSIWPSPSSDLNQPVQTAKADIGQFFLQVCKAHSLSMAQTVLALDYSNLSRPLTGCGWGYRENKKMCRCDDMNG